MESPATNRTAYRLYELQAIIKAALGDAFPGAYWVTAEIAECKSNQRGHCYLELVEKEEDKIIAQVKATIWAYDYRRLSQKFKAATGEPLKPGMRLLLFVSVSFHEVYGLSLNVKDIDPTYTLGEMARKRKEIIERLRREGVIDENKKRPLPLVPQHIAVISSPTAAGYGDFFNQLDGNLYGYKLVHILFPAVMQGQEAELSVTAALKKIRRLQDRFDVVVIIRGGGSAIDLSCFDSYDLAAAIARFPLPVITGIGHEKDDTIADMVAHTKMKTPTAVAEFLLSGIRSFEEGILSLQHRLSLSAERLLKDARYALNGIAQKLVVIPACLAAPRNRLLLLERELQGRLRESLLRQHSRLEVCAQAVRLLDPAKVLRRGYSITRCNGAVVKEASQVKKGAVITTRLHNGTVTSIVGQTKEAKQREQEQATCLLPGFERAGTDRQ